MQSFPATLSRCKIGSVNYFVIPYLVLFANLEDYIYVQQ